MNTSPKIGLPIAAALLTPSFVAMIYFSGLMLFSRGPLDGFVSISMYVLVLSLIISAAHLVALGLPAVFILRKLKVFNQWSVVLAGLILGCIPTSFYSWPTIDGDHDYTVNGVKKISNGMLTFEGWLSYVEGVAIAGGLGALAGFAFWMAWKHENIKPNPANKD